MNLLNGINQLFEIHLVCIRFHYESLLQHDAHLAVLFAVGEFVQIFLEPLLHFRWRKK
jgi:hypothetical protein